MMNDTMKLLKECDSGCKTAMDGMAQVLKHVSSATMRAEITACTDRHAAFSKRCQTLLNAAGESSGQPPVFGSMMMQAGTGIKLAMNDDDRKIAEMRGGVLNSRLTTMNETENFLELLSKNHLLPDSERMNLSSCSCSKVLMCYLPLGYQLLSAVHLLGYLLLYLLVPKLNENHHLLRM